MSNDRTSSAGWALLELGGLYEAWNDPLRAARAYFAAHRIETDVASRLKEQASLERVRFQRQYNQPAIYQLYHQAQHLSWKELAESLLSKNEPK